MATQPQFLVLAAGPSGMAAVDVANGALVRASWQGRTEEQLSPYDVVTAAVAPFDQDAGVTFAPEAVSLSSPPRKVGSLHRRAADKLVRGWSTRRANRSSASRGPPLRSGRSPGTARRSR